MNRILKTVMIIGLLLVGSVTIYALTNRFLMISQTSNFTKKKIFEFDLSTGLTEAEIGPNDSMEIEPVIYNDARLHQHNYPLLSRLIESESHYICLLP